MIPGSANPLLLATAAGAGGYQVERSIRLNSADSAHLSRTPASAGNRKTWTWAGWVKRSASANQALFSCHSASSDASFTEIDFLGDTLRVSGWTTVWRNTTQVFRDFSAWYHILIAFDTTQATAADRIKIYVNGTQITTFATSNNPTLNTDYGINQAAAHNIGRYNISGTGYDYLSGYLADVHFIDGQALDPTSFTEVSATTGQLIPKAYTGTYGTNGFHLPFSDNSTAAALGTDTSSNSNTWTVNNISVAAGAGNDSLTDTPSSYGTDTGAGGEVRGNYCTWNPLDKGSTIALANGNLDASTASAGWTSVRATIGVNSGKYYWEITSNTTLNSSNTLVVGIGNSSMSVNSYIGSTADGKGYYAFDGNKYPENTAYGATYTLNDVIGVALDMDAGTLTFYKNGVSQGQSHSGLTGTWFPALSIYGTASTTLNTGARPFAYTAPSGYKALCTTNLPDPVVAQPSTVMDVKLYTGNGSTQTISGLGFSPDLVWIKNRAAADNHKLLDTIRGAINELESNTTDAEVANADGLTAFNSDGFDLGVDVEYNTSSEAYVAWTWDAGSSTVTNTQGSITSSVRANASAGFSIVTYTGVGGTSTIGHGLGVAPQMLIIKPRSASGNWVVYHKYNTSSGAPDSSKNALYLNLTNQSATNNAYPWSSTQPSSTVFTGNDSYGALAVNSSGVNYVAYCFAPVAGYSAFGSYTGNGSADGPFVYTGFRPRWIMIKHASGSIGSQSNSWWMIVDTERSTFNDVDVRLHANLSDLEYTNSNIMDILSNGFKLRSVADAWNHSNGSYIYAAFAEHPFKTARAR